MTSTTVRITGRARMQAERLRADCGYRSLTLAIGALLEFYENSDKSLFLAYVREHGDVVGEFRRRAPAQEASLAPQDGAAAPSATSTDGSIDSGADAVEGPLDAAEAAPPWEVTLFAAETESLVATGGAK